MAVQFIVPLAFRDLLKSGGVGQYVVQEVQPVRQLPSQLSAYKVALRSQGPQCVLQHFDALYSMLYHFRTLDASMKEDLLELLVKATSQHASELPAVLEDLSLAQADKNTQLNTLKMNCFLLVHLVEAFEVETYKAALGNVEPSGKGRKAKSKADGFLWETERENVLQTITHLLQLDIRRLWSMSLIEEEFISMVTGCCYKMMENPSIGALKNKSLWEALSHLLGVAVKRSNDTLSVSVKVIQLLQHFEHLAPVLVHALALWATEYGMKSLVGEIMRKIGQKSCQDLSRESSSVKTLAAFITQLAEKIPTIVMPNISLLLDYLDGEPYIMRNAVLTVMGEMVIRVLSGDRLDDAEKNTRDNFLDTLQEHLHDINTFVRSCVMQIFNRIVQEKALPLSRFQAVVTLVVGRLFDKSVKVCKNAIQVLASFLANNPFTCKLSSVDLKEPLEKETSKLKELKEKRSVKPPVVVISPEEEWEAMFPELKETLHTLAQESDEEDESPEEEEEMDTIEKLQERVLHLLKITSYKHSIFLVKKGISLFPDDSLFGVEDADDEVVLGILEQIFTAKGKNLESPPSEDPLPPPDGENKDSEETSDEQDKTDLSKQEMLVQYLTDARYFALKIEEAIDVISKMMYEAASSVVQEVIEFFVTVSQFGVPQALIGVRRMLPLVWSKEPGVRDAVVGAYRQLYLSSSGSESERVRAQNLIRNLSLLMVDSSAGVIQSLEEIVLEFVQKGEINPAVPQLLWEKFTLKSPCSDLERRAAVMMLGMMSRGQPEIVLSNIETLVNVGLAQEGEKDYRLAQHVCNCILKISAGQKSPLGKKSAPLRLPNDHCLFQNLKEAVVGGVAQQNPYWLPFKETAVKLVYEMAEEPEEICTEVLQRCSQQVLQEFPNQEESVIPAFLLTHLLSLAGDVALQLVVYLECTVSAELRRQRLVREEQAAEKQGKNKQRKSKGNDSMGEDDMGLVGASADDADAELIQKICDNELLNSQQYLSAFLPLVLKVCKNSGNDSDPALCTAAALALTKFMMISSDFCDSHLRLLFTLLEKSSLPAVRSNIMIALGDLSIRFPNLIEPWTPHLYARLRDDSKEVRKTSAIVMTHLILKDMVKVKGQVSEMAVLLIDSAQEISSLAKNFFTELSNKGNAVYNLLPDIISRLSDPECGVEEDAFHTIMRHLLSYITKDKQTESLVEKMCHRFRTARTERQWRDLAHCLSLLPFSEKGLVKIQDCFDCYGDKLSDDAVYNSFISVIGKMRKGAKPELKTMIDEFEKKLTVCHNKGLENMDVSEEGVPDGENPPPSAVKKNVPAKRRPLKSVNRSQKVNEEAEFQTPKGRPPKRPQRKATITFSSDEESDLEAELSEADTPKNPTPIRRTTTRSRAR